ncbi:MAG: hypothetical protein ACRD6W_09655, partial [Nitrososphaerales archaeon]
LGSVVLDGVRADASGIESRGRGNLLDRTEVADPQAPTRRARARSTAPSDPQRARERVGLQVNPIGPGTLGRASTRW